MPRPPKSGYGLGARLQAEWTIWRRLHPSFGAAETAPELNRSERLAALCLIGLVTVEHCLFAGNRTDISLGFTIAYGALLAYVLSTPWGRASIGVVKGLGTAAALFALTLLAVGASLIPHRVGAAPGGGVVSATASAEPLASAIEAVKLLGYACAFAVTALIACDDRRSRYLLRALIFGSLAFAVFCLAADASAPLHIGGWTKPYITRGRISGLFSSANTVATVFGAYALIAAAELARIASQLTAPDLRRQVLYVATGRPIVLTAFGLNFLCLMLSGSRGGIASFCLAFAALALWLGWRSPRRRALFAALGGVIVLVGLLGGGMAIGRYATGAYGNDLRGVWMGTTWSLFLQAPAQGWGLGTLQTMFHTVATEQSFGRLDWAGAAHNVYLQWLAEGGLIATIPMWGTIAWILSCAIETMPADGRLSIRRPALLIAALLFLGHSLVEYSLQEPSAAVLFSIILGLGMGQANLQRRPSSRRRRSAAPSGGGASPHRSTV